MDKSAIKTKITEALRKSLGATKGQVAALIPKAFTAGKLYEAYVLGLVCNELASREGCKLVLHGGATKIALKSSPGPINPTYPHIEVTKNGVHIANIWTDVEFTSMSAQKSGKMSMSYGDFHEMDIAVVLPNCSPRPFPSEILLAVECKNTGYQKSLLREILGIRRELSLLTGSKPTAFSAWPRDHVPADPSSCIAVYSTDPAVLNYGSPGQFFGIDFFYEPL
jgi:hypothetical protein